MTIPGGYILLARKQLESEIMDRSPLRLKLWIWMLLRASYKPHNGLQRGQFFTTIDDMREAMSWYVGYRKVRPTRDEIRSCYEALTKATMITTAKTTRGMIITVLNYDLYQTPTNYEAHTETHSENTAKPTTPPHCTKEGERKNNKLLPANRQDLQSDCTASFTSKRGRQVSGERYQSFMTFWDAFGYKRGRAEAADAWLDIPSLTDTVVSQIVHAAEIECKRRPALKRAGHTPKMAQGWLSGRRWEDEDYLMPVEPEFSQPTREELYGD